jgi:hypothetical protein
MKSSKVSTSVSLFALVLVLGPAAAQPAHAGKSGYFANANAIDVAFLVTFSPTLLPAYSTYRMSGAAPKVALAQAALEDAAVWYDSGRLTGVLPIILDHVKEVLAEERRVHASDITDREAVDHIADVASAVAE